MITRMAQNTSEWLQFRRKRIGASDAPIIMKMSPYKTVYELWQEKKSDQESTCSPAMQYGKNNEETARKLFEALTGLIVFPDFMAISDKHDWQVASLDGITIELDAIVEIKCANEKDHEMARDKLIPPKYFPQLQHQMACTNLDWAYYFSWRQGAGAIVIVNRDQAYIDLMTSLEEKFYNDNMLGGIEPELVEKDHKKKLKDAH